MKKKLIFGSALGIIMCSSLIAGATMALFTSESKVNIAVTSGKVDVSAEAKEVTTYTNGNATTENGTFENKGTAVIDDSGKLVLSGITPGDKAVVKLEITNGSSVAYKQRISLSSTLDAELMDQLIVGVSEDNQSYTYYSDYVTAWEKGEPVEEPVTTTMYLSIELPAYVGDDWQGKEGEIALAVEAVQGNADVSDTAVANEVYLVNDQTGLAKAIADMESGDTVVLYSSDWKDTDAEIAYDGDKEITVRGYGLDNVKINADEGTVNLYNDANSLTVTAIAGNSLHIYGNIGSAEVADGHAVVEPGAYVKNVNVVPSESNSVKFEVKKEATVTNIKVNTSNSAASADVVIAEGVKVSDMTVEGSGDVTLDNSGTISNTTVSEDSNFENIGTGESCVNATVTTAENLKKALAINGATVTLGDDIPVDAVVPEGVSVILDLNGHKITNVSDHTIINNGVLEIKDSLGGGVVDNITHAKASIYNAQSAQTVLNGGTFIRSAENGSSSENNGGNSYYTIINFGTMEINSGVTVKQDGRFSSLVENGWYDGNKNTTKEPATLVINGGTFNGGLNTIKNDDYGYLTINNGEFTNVAQAVVLNWNVAELNGGVYRAEGATDSIILNGYINDTMDKGQLSVKNIEYSGAPLFARMGGSKNAGFITVYDAETLKAALAVDTATVILGSDIELDQTIVISAIKLVIDLNEKTLNYTAVEKVGKFEIGNGADVTVKNGTVNMPNRPYYGFYIKDNAKFTLSHVVANSNDCLVFGAGQETIIIDECTLTSAYPIYHNGSTSPSTMKITNSYIDGGIYVSNASTPGRERQTLIIDGCTIIGMTAVELKHTDATITNSTLVGTSVPTGSGSNNNGSCTSGYAVAVTTNGVDDYVTGNVTIDKCKVYNGSISEEQNGYYFVFTVAEGFSVIIDGQEVSDYNSYQGDYTNAQG